MAQRIPEIETMTITEARNNLSTVTKEVYAGDARVAVEKSGVPMQGIVSLDDVKQVKLFREQMREFQQVRECMREAFTDVSEEELEREIALAIAEDRRERRAAKANAVTAT